MKNARPYRRLAILAATIPLLATGTCLSMTQDALITGFFSAVAASGAERISEELGTTSGSTSSDTAKAALPARAAGCTLATVMDETR